MFAMPGCREHVDTDNVAAGMLCRGLRRARDEFNQQDAIVAGTEPPFEYGLICTAMRMFDQNYSSYFRDLCR